MNSPASIFAGYTEARRFKSAIGNRGLYDQIRINERFYVGDQWHGASLASERPLVRHNIIKRIGDYKISQLTGCNPAVSFSAEGFSRTVFSEKGIEAARKELARGESSVWAPLKADSEVNLMLSVLGSYRKTTADRVKLKNILDLALRDAYIRGTGVVYTYFDPDIKTGLYADRPGGTPILGDIVCQRLKIENIYFADPTVTDLQKQPYIILAEEKTSEEILSEAKRYGADPASITRLAGKGGQKLTLLTKLFKAEDTDGKVKVFATKVTEDAVVRPPFCLGIAVYPLSVFAWERRDGCIYGDSEITYIIPNQIAINRMITAGVWSAMSSGMPIMVVNGDIVSGEITNEPGQIIKAYGTAEEINSSVNFVTPPDCAEAFDRTVDHLIFNTLTQCGANEAALGDAEANNTSAIIELREASAKYLLPLKNRYLAFIEDISMIWAEFFFAMYGKRGLKISDENGIWYFPFDASRYKDLVLTVTVIASEGVTRGEKERISSLDKLLDKGAISPKQYLERLPEGIIPDIRALLEEAKGEKTE